MNRHTRPMPACPLRSILGAVLAVATASLLVACKGQGNEEAAPAGTSGASAASGSVAPAPAASGAAKPALSVSAVSLQAATWARSVAANGTIAAWQEAVIGAEVSGLRLTEVRVNVGDTVKQGQVLAQLDRKSVEADLAATRANLAEAQANMADAHANADRARQLQPTGVMSAQQIQQYITAEQAARARTDSLRARLAVEELRLKQTQVVAPDAGVISGRSATVGSVVQPGQELFRLIRGNRLEWRAEVPQTDLGRIRPGMAALLTLAGGGSVAGKVRVVAPTVDAATRNGIVYVDLPQPGGARAGMFATGSFDVGQAEARTLPQTAVLLREGYSYVFVIGPDNRVTQKKVAVGRRQADRVEIVDGLEPAARVVASGVGFLADGDTVHVVAAPAASQPSASMATR